MDGRLSCSCGDQTHPLAPARAASSWPQHTPWRCVQALPEAGGVAGGGSAGGQAAGSKRHERLGWLLACRCSPPPPLPPACPQLSTGRRAASHLHLRGPRQSAGPAAHRTTALRRQHQCDGAGSVAAADKQQASKSRDAADHRRQLAHSGGASGTFHCGALSTAVALACCAPACTPPCPCLQASVVSKAAAFKPLLKQGLQAAVASLSTSQGLRQRQLM